MTNQLYKEMFSSAVHIGHSTQKCDPRNKKRNYIFGEQNGIHLINLESTLTGLENAVTFLTELYRGGKTILFVSTKPQSVRIVEELAKGLKMPYVVSKWIPGLITNFDTVKTRIKYMLDLKEQQAAGDFEKYTKKEASKLKKMIDKLESSLGGVADLKSKPDAVFVIDAVRDGVAVREANKLNIPVVALIDSNANPARVNYPIPGNDDAIKSLEFFAGYVAKSLKTPRVK